MKKIEETSLKHDLLWALFAAVELAMSGLRSWPLRITDVVFVALWSVFLGVFGTLAVLKYNGTIQVREPSPESIASTQKYKALFMLVVVVAVALFLGLCLM